MNGARLRAAPDYLWLAMWVLALVAVIVYGWWWFGDEVDEACALGLIHEGGHFGEMCSSLVPLVETCVFEDGTTHAVVPGWVNPVVFGGLAGAVGAAAAAFWIGRVAKSRS